MDLSLYVRVGRYDLPEPTRTTAPANNVLAQEASAVTYDWDTDTLFVTGDGGTSITQVSKTGQLIDTMTLARGNSPQGTEFYDTEGLTYVGNGQFVMTEERDRNAVQFTYKAGTTLTRADAQTVHLGTPAGNMGLEGVSYDPLTGGFIFVKEKSPIGVFQTTIDFAAGKASNGSATTENSVNLFDPNKLGVIDVADVYALSNLPALHNTADEGHLLLLSQESAEILEVDRAGNIISVRTLQSDPGNPLSIVEQQQEGLTMDRNGNIYVVSENGGGDFDHPQLWVFAPSTVPNQAPTAITLANAVTQIAENTNTSAHVRVADVIVTDDGIGTNKLTLSGADAASFEVDSTGLYIKAGTNLDFETKTSYSVTVNVDDMSLGGTPDASKNYTLSVTDVVNESAGAVVTISEVAPWSSSNSPVGADWFEVTNNGQTAVNISGWKMDDNSKTFALGATLNGISSIGAGESVIFLETADLATAKQAFINTWFGGHAPAGLQFGSYSAGGVGLGTTGDEVNLFDSSGVLKASVSFGNAATGPFTTFDNSAGINSAAISKQSVVGIQGAFAASMDSQEIGSPGTVGKLYISEVAPWSSGNSPVGADWFEVTNGSPFAIDMTGWKMDDNSESPAAAVSMGGIGSIAAGESVIYLETSDLASAKQTFIETWFAGKAPAGLQFGSYSGSGVGLSTSGDAVNLYDASNVLRASVNFGASPATGPFTTFDNAAGLDKATITTASSVGVHGAIAASADKQEIGSPGSVGKLFISEVAPWSSGNSPIAVDWFEVTNSSTSTIDISGWKVDDDSASFANALALNGITSIAAGESVIFMETANLAATKQLFIDTWFGGHAPAGLQFGNYTGSGIGLGAGGDQVNLYDSSGALKANVSFGASPASAPFTTFDNAAGLNGAISTASAIGTNGGFVASTDSKEIGSPGSTANPVNGAPVAASDTATVEGNKSVTVSVLANDSDPNGDKLSVTSVSGGLHGTTRFNADYSGVIYTPTIGYEGKDSFTYVANDGKGGTAEATVTVTVTGAAGTPVNVAITEVAPWSSGNSPIAADWFEVTNKGTTAVDISGWKVDDDSASFANALALNGVTSIGAGESVIFMETSTLATTKQSFIDTWFGGHAPAGLQFGSYSGAGVGLGAGGDQVNLYDGTGALKAAVSFGASPANAPFTTFDNAAGLNGPISTASAIGTNGGFAALADSKEIGSPGTVIVAPPANAAPVAAADVASVETNKSVTISVLANDSNSNGDKLSVTAVSGGLHGTTAFNADYSAVIYTPTAGYAGKDSFSYIANDGKGGIAEATVTVTVTAPAPVVNLAVTEVAPWSSGNSPIAADWFEVTNKGSTAVNLAGWKVDDNSASFGSALALNGITSIAAGESVIFMETANLAATKQLFIDTWFGGTAPAGLQFGNYTGSGIGLGAGGDQVNLFDSSGALKANVSFGASPASAPFTTFENSAGLNGPIVLASAIGVHGALAAIHDLNEIGSPGVVIG